MDQFPASLSSALRARRGSHETVRVRRYGLGCSVEGLEVGGLGKQG